MDLAIKYWKEILAGRWKEFIHSPNIYLILTMAQALHWTLDMQCGKYITINTCLFRLLVVLKQGERKDGQPKGAECVLIPIQRIT